jgi:SOS-response transcriptional repressor LexA
VLDFIIEYKRNHDGCAPVIRLIMQAMNFKTPSVITYYLNILESQGKIRRVYDDDRDAAQSGGIMVVGGTWSPPKAEVS